MLKKIDYSLNIKAAKEIKSLLTNDERYVRLYAPMQCGKTTVINHLFKLFLEEQNKRGKTYFDKMYFILSDSSCTLNNQNNTSVETFFNQYLEEKWHMDLDEKIVCIHRPDMKKLDLDSKKKYLLIFDEHHIAQEKTTGKAGLQHKFGFMFNSPSDKWTNKNISIVTVTATPIPEEIEAHRSFRSSPVRFLPGNNYFSFQKMMRKGLINQAVSLFNSEKTDISDTLKDQLDIFEKNVSTRKKKYAIIRFNSRNAKDYTLLEKKLSRRFEICHINAKAKESDLRTKLSNTKPVSRGVIIIIKQMARAGFDMNTSKVDFMWDTQKTYFSVTAQSLAGRACCYEGRKDKGYDVRIFCDVTNVEECIKFYKAMEQDRIQEFLEKEAKIKDNAFSTSSGTQWFLRPISPARKNQEIRAAKRRTEQLMKKTKYKAKFSKDGAVQQQVHHLRYMDKDTAFAKQHGPRFKKYARQLKTEKDVIEVDFSFTHAPKYGSTVLALKSPINGNHFYLLTPVMGGKRISKLKQTINTAE